MSERSQIIVTGINGFVGEHLAQHLKSSNFAVSGVGRDSTPNPNVAPFLDSYQQADLLNETQVNSLVLKNAAAIIHLAGLASVAESFDKPDLYKTGNAEMTNNLLNAAEQQGFTGRVVAVSTGALYSPNQPMPLSEGAETTQGSPYAIGKLRAEEVIKQHRAAGTDVVIARPFNHIGPGQGNGFLVADLYDQLMTAKESGISDILVGNLTTKRDYTDVRDIVSAYAKLATADSLEHDTYNISSGSSLAGFDILHYLQKAMNLESITPSVDQSKIRPTDAQDIIGDSTRIQAELDWSPVSNPEKAIIDFVARRQL